MAEATGPRGLTFGEQAVELTFNPAAEPTVQKLKELYAAIISPVCRRLGTHAMTCRVPPILYRGFSPYLELPIHACR